MMIIRGLKKKKAEECVSHSCDSVKIIYDVFYDNNDFVNVEILPPWNMTDYEDFIMLTVENYWYAPEKAIKIKRSDFIEINIF